MRVVDGNVPAAVPALSYAVSGVRDRRELVDALITVLGTLVPSDGLAWNAVDVATGEVEVHGWPSEVYHDPALAETLAGLDDHPMIESYLGRSEGSQPRRLSDLVSFRELRRTRTYAELLAPLRLLHMTTVLTARMTPMAGRCWTFNRESTPFSDAEVALLSQLQPLLVTLDQTVPGDPPEPLVRGEAAGLTARELEVLRLVSEGRTAVACGHLLRISPATVRKHLEHAYDKLGVHDRLLAVHRARELGLVAMPAQRQPASATEG